MSSSTSMIFLVPNIFFLVLPLKRQEKNASENVVCWSRLLQIIA